MSHSVVFSSILAASFGLFAAVGFAQAPPPAPAYGMAIGIDAAKRAAAAAIAEARKNNWTMAVAVLDTAASLVYFEKVDGTQLASVNISIGKAKTAVLFKRPSKSFQETLAAGGDGLRLLAMEGVLPVEGGIPLVVDGKIVGSIGVSGGSSQQDGQCAKAGADAVK